MSAPVPRRWRRAVGRRARALAYGTRGAAAVEFALIVPVLLVFVMAIIDVGRMTAVAASLATAVRDGARQGATVVDWTDAAQVTAVRNRVIAGFQPFGGPALTASGVTATLDAAGNVTVAVTGYQYRPITPFARLVGLGTINLSRTTVFRWERAS